MVLIYGVDTTGTITPDMVRAALVDCFYDAHSSQTGIANSNTKTAKVYCEQIVRKAFTETGGDFDHPTKDSILATLPWLAEFSKSFRDQTVIQRHMTEIQQLIVSVS